MNTPRANCLCTIAVAAALAGGGAPATAADSAAVAAIAPGDAEVLADRPLAVWRFEDEVGGEQAVAERFAADAAASQPNDVGPSGLVDTSALTAAAERLPAAAIGGVALGEPGPRPPRVTAFGTTNAAALFGGGSSYLKLGANAARFDEFQFTAGDSITLEAWVNPLAITEGQQVCVIGKGRTGRRGFVADNQNWSLRLTGRDGRARPSFLFHSGSSQQSGDKLLHRWTADEWLASRGHQLHVR